MSKSNVIKDWPEYKKAGTSLYSCSKVILSKKEKEIEIPWEYSEAGDHGHIFNIANLSFYYYYNGLLGLWYVSGDGIAGSYSPKKCSSKEEVDRIVIDVIKKNFKKFKDFLE